MFMLIFWTTYPPLLVHVVIEYPLNIPRKVSLSAVVDMGVNKNSISRKVGITLH